MKKQKKTKCRRECMHCEKWFNSETHRRKVCDKCKEKSHKRKRKKYGTPTWKKIKQNADGRHYG